MPVFLSVLIIGAIVLFGVVKITKAACEQREKEKIEAEIQKLCQEAKERLQQAHDETKDTLEELGELKLNVWSQQIGRFANLFEWLKDIEIVGAAQVGELKKVKEELAEIKKISFKAGEIATGGVAALGAGTLAGVASYGGATMLASASTGTAISTLSGAAATNATLAWFGGGSLAAGGLGMAGGMYILGGIVAAPVLAVGGLVFEAQARKKLAEAKTNYELAKQYANQMDNATTITRSIQRAASLCHDTIQELCNRVDIMLDEFEQVLISHLHQVEVSLKKSNLKGFRSILWFSGIGRPSKLKTIEGQSKEGRRISYKSMTENDRRTVHQSVEMVYILKQLLEIPLLDNTGALKDDYKKMIERSRNYITKEIL